MTEFDDEKLIRALRSSGTDGPAFAMTPLQETTRRGRAARRRRTALAGAGATALAAATVTAALAVPSMLDGQNAVPSPAGDPTEEPTDEPAGEAIPVTADEMVAAHKAAVFETLPDGFVRLTEENMELGDSMAGFAVAREAPATDGLPDGMTGGITFMRFPASDAMDLTGRWCEGVTEKGFVTTACADLQVDGEIVKVQETTPSEGGEAGAYEATRTSYQQPSGDVIVLDLHAWEDDRRTTPQRLAKARAWVDATHEQIVSIVRHPSFQPTEWQERRLAEAQDLAADMGDDWYVLDGPPAAGVRPTEALEGTLPGEAIASIVRDVRRGTDLSKLCTAGTDDGIRREACEPAPGADAVVSYGVMVDPEHRGDESFDTRLADVIVYHEQNGSIVKVRVVVAGMGAGSAPDPASLRPWLEEQVPDLVRAATSFHR